MRSTLPKNVLKSTNERQVFIKAESDGNQRLKFTISVMSGCVTSTIILYVRSVPSNKAFYCQFFGSSDAEYPRPVIVAESRDSPSGLLIILSARQSAP